MTKECSLATIVNESEGLTVFKGNPSMTVKPIIFGFGPECMCIA